ncbi:MAG: hypothetical protein V4760_14700 [Bdellovibrionota bacterium]
MYRFVKILVSSIVALATASAWADGAVVTTTEIEREVEARLGRVEQFEFIRQEAAKRGLRVYLFGGTAAGFAHYVKWDLQREKGDARFQKERFDYDYTNIYRSTQDLDVVVDGDPASMKEQLAALQSLVRARYPHVQGGKSQWEFRPLRQQIGVAGQPGYKEAILGSADFMNQHTDSNSTGLIELTKPLAGESRVRDVRDWNSHPSQFLKDVTAGTIRYYFSPTHETTSRFKAGDNPALFSAVRFLTKAFQFGLAMTKEDLARVESIIESFDVKTDLESPRAQVWLVKNGKKLVQHAIDVEYAIEWIGLLGLDRKLAVLDDARVPESLAWWMTKEPLKTSLVGKGEGRTAGELKLTVVAHETKSMTAFESIIRAHTGVPNVLISRSRVSGETAMHGDGFYTRMGLEGGQGTGQTIRFTVDPRAREGADFFFAGADFVVFKNRAALRVVPESLSLTPVQYFEMLGTGRAIDHSELGNMERLKARTKTKAGALTASDIAKIDQIVASAVARKVIQEELYSSWLELPSSKANVTLKKDLALSGLVNDRMDLLARELVSVDFQFNELVKIAFGPAISHEMSVEFRMKALAKADTLAEVVALMKPLREIPGVVDEKGNFAPMNAEGLSRKQMKSLERRAFSREELEFVRQASPKLWSLGPDQATLANLIFQVEVKAQWEHVGVMLAESTPDAKAAQLLMNQIHKMVLQNRDAERFKKAWAAVLLRANVKGWLKTSPGLMSSANSLMIGRGQAEILIDISRRESFDKARAKVASTPIWPTDAAYVATFEKTANKLKCTALFSR